MTATNKHMTQQKYDRHVADDKLVCVMFMLTGLRRWIG